MTGTYRYSLLAIGLVLLAAVVASGENGKACPLVHSHLRIDTTGLLEYVDADGSVLPQVTRTRPYTLEQLRSTPVGTENGLRFDLGNAELNGTLYYGLIHEPGVAKHPYPVYFKRTATIRAGVAEVAIKGNMSGKYDFVDWQRTGRLRLGYRVVNDKGHFLYDGKIMVRGTGPFEADTSIVEGPFVNLLGPDGAVISFVTNIPIRGSVTADNRTFADTAVTSHHEISMTGLQPDREYRYTVSYGEYRDSYAFRTAPPRGSRQPFTFAYASDGRANNGGGERNLWGVNAYMLKRIAALCMDRQVRFFQFTGDLIDGYVINEGDIDLQYANWKRTVEPFAHYLPFVAAFGNHEALVHIFATEEKQVWVDKFPYATASSEVVFARNFVNPTNGPMSEDGTAYDPDPAGTDFPPYAETAFHYTFGNVAIVSLNSNYWYSPSVDTDPPNDGNPHAYVMDNQLAWLKAALEHYEADDGIDHVFVTIHTPIFPNGGHVGDDMWYGGNNDIRPWIAGEPAARGIIERRDELLDVIVNGSSKVRAALTGDEHNYNRLHITEDMPRYPETWTGSRLKLDRPFWQINNGAAGAPYYGRETTPWKDHLKAFSTQNALVLFRVDGNSIRVEVLNPDTFEKLDEFDLM